MGNEKKLQRRRDIIAALEQNVGKASTEKMKEFEEKIKETAKIKGKKDKISKNKERDKKNK